MRAFLPVAAIALALGGLSAKATDWSLSAGVSQGFTVVHDFDPDPDDDAVGFRSTTGFDLNLAGRNEATTVGLSAGARLLGRTDSDDGDAFETPLPRFSGSIATRGRRLSADADFSVVPSFVSDREFDSILVEDPDSGVVSTEIVPRDVDPIEITLNANAGAAWRVSPRDTLGATFSVQRREYDETTDDFQPTTALQARATYSRALDNVSNAGLSFGVRRFITDEENQDDTLATTIAAQASRRLTPRHAGALSLGVSLVDDGDDIEPALTGSARLSYATRQASYTMSLSQDFDQEDDGTVSNVTQARLSGSYNINTVSSIGAGATASTRFDLGGDRSEEEVILGLSANYRLRLTPDWSLTLSGSLRLERDSDDDNFRGSDRILLSISRSFALAP